MPPTWSEGLFFAVQNEWARLSLCWVLMPWNGIQQAIALVFDNGVQSSCKVSSSKWRRRFAKCISVISDKISQWWHSTKFHISSFKSLVWSFSKRSRVAACLGPCRFRVRSNCLGLAVGLGVSDLVEAMRWPVDPKLRSYKRWMGSFFGSFFFCLLKYISMNQSYPLVRPFPLHVTHVTPVWYVKAAGSWARQLLEAELWGTEGGAILWWCPVFWLLYFSFYRKSVWLYVCKFTTAVFSQGFPCLTLLFLFCAMCDFWHCRLINSCMEAYAKAPSTLWSVRFWYHAIVTLLNRNWCDIRQVA